MSVEKLLPVQTTESGHEIASGKKAGANGEKQYFTSKGEWYIDFLRYFHTFLGPRTYLEIGSAGGGSLSKSGCSTIAVDPNFTLGPAAHAKRDVTMLFQMTSDRFFQKYNPEVLFGAKIDLAFLDGLHEAETLLRDFINTEKYCRKNSIILLHDMLPFNEEVIVRTQPQAFVPWTGDVWKVLPILKEFRPDLQIQIFDANPTGLVAITNLDPGSTVLEDNYSKIWEKWGPVDLEHYGPNRYFSEYNILPTSSVTTAPELRRYFWL